MGRIRAFAVAFVIAIACSRGDHSIDLVTLCRDAPTAKERSEACAAVTMLTHSREAWMSWMRALVEEREFQVAHFVAGPIFQTSWQGDREREAFWAFMPEVMELDPDAERHEKKRVELYYQLQEIITKGRLAEAIGVSEEYLYHSRRAWKRAAFANALYTRARVLDRAAYDDDARSMFLDAGYWFVVDAMHLWVRWAQGVFRLDRSRGDPEGLQISLTILEPLVVEVKALAVQNPDDGSLVVLLDGVLINLAYVYRNLGRPDDALDALAQVTADARAKPNTRLVEGMISATKGDLARAHEMLVAISDDDLEPDFIWERHFELALLARAAGRLDEADHELAIAIETIEGLRERNDFSIRPQLLPYRSAPYAERIDLQRERGDTKEALAAAEALHSRTLLDAIQRVDQNVAPTPQRFQDLLGLLRGVTTSTVYQPLDATGITALLPGREIIVLAEADRRLWRFHALDGVIEMDELPKTLLASTNGIGELEAWRSAPGDVALGDRVSAALLPAKLGPATRPLYVVATGALDKLPLAALRHDGKFLIETRTLIRLPAIAALVCRQPRGPTTDRHVILGDAAGDLPAARREAKAIARRVGTFPRVGWFANLAALDDARRARLLHVAVHGSVTGRSGGLELVDGRLDAADVLQRGIDPEIAVLAGCATAQAPDPEGWRALPPAFLAAGSRAVVATLRNVVDDNAAVLMASYYDALLASGLDVTLDPAEALAVAQRAAIGKRMDVGSWSSFAVWEAGCERAPKP